MDQNASNKSVPSELPALEEEVLPAGETSNTLKDASDSYKSMLRVNRLTRAPQQHLGNETWGSSSSKETKKKRPPLPSPSNRRSSSFMARRDPRRSISLDPLPSPSSLSSTYEIESQTFSAKVNKRTQDIKGLLFGKYVPSLDESSSFSVSGFETSRSFKGSQNSRSFKGSQNFSTEFRRSMYRQYSVGDAVLVQCNDKWQSCVNRFGFPPGNGRSLEERSGPYLFVLGRVQTIHYEENSVYYTVRREDTGVDIRGDSDLMAPLLSTEGEEAARKAAQTYASGEALEDLRQTRSEEYKQEKGLRSWIENICVFLLLPFFWLYDCFQYVIGARLYRWGKTMIRAIQTQSYLFLNGMKPYACAFRITTVNIVVLCSLWYIFIDSIRLAFIPGRYDRILAVVSCTVWMVLLAELLLEYFLRPDEYQSIIQSDKAYTPTTVRFISGVHLFVELLSLTFFVPEFYCLFDHSLQCGGRLKFSFLHSTILTITGPTSFHAFTGRLFYVFVRLRVYGLIRHWKHMWINENFLKKGTSSDRSYYKDLLATSKSDLHKSVAVDTSISSVNRSMENTQKSLKQLPDPQKQSVESLSNIGTALMVTNSYRSLTILCIIMGIFPMINLIAFQTAVNPVTINMVEQLQQTNWMTWEEEQANETMVCEFFESSVQAWINSWEYMNQSSYTTETDTFLVDLVISPSRCLTNFQSMVVKDFVVRPRVKCEYLQEHFELNEDGLLDDSDCLQISLNNLNPDFRSGCIQTEQSSVYQTDSSTSVFFVSARFNQTRAVEYSSFFSFLLQLSLVLTVISSLIVLRKDAKNYVLGPLKSMLRIVARYAQNPLAQATVEDKDSNILTDTESDIYVEADDDSNDMEFQTDETEQLIRAVAKITDLLRKCWGVAGADIISTNLASRETALTEAFNPTAPGKSVYALFAFAAINGFDHCLRCLEGDVMILINDVAAVLHREVYRWGFEDSGQCNKNLGEAFLMVFRIGLVKEVMEKLEEATKVVFSTTDSKKLTIKKKHVQRDNLDVSDHTVRTRKVSKSRKMTKNDAIANAMQLSLQSLPGIATFTDRAVIGMLKSFAGIHRDKKLMDYSRDFRLSAGVGAFSVNMVFGMDAGWAVEGAVGSEYKIDATYLSPHVNMASRMMSACKHYGVTILLSEAVQELMSDIAKSKLRSVDRVTVKGSTWVQKLYTYDARHKGADFFLFNRSDDLADLDADRYVANIWNTDQDLKAMRKHVTDDFVAEFNIGMQAYLSGDWKAAIKNFEAANAIMVETALEEGYLQEELDASPDHEDILKSDCSDGPSSYLISFMKSHGGVAPKGWKGWHKLLSK